MSERIGHVFLLSCTLALCGCAKEPTTPTILEASSNPYVSDLPLPINFKLEDHQSEDKVSAGHRSVKHVYRGKEKLQAVKNFYQHYMPQANWAPVEHSLSRGVYLLKYRKGRERCDVRIERMPSGLFGTVTQIRATILHDNAEMPG